MKVIELANDIAERMEEEIGPSLVSVVLYGRDMYMEKNEAQDYNFLIILEKLDLPIMKKIRTLLEKSELKITNPLIIERVEMEGMMDSVPICFLDILISFQTISGKPLLKGLSSLSQEHLRAQTERFLRESLCRGRMNLIEGMGKEELLRSNVEELRETFLRSIKMYHLINKPWLIEEEEHLTSFFSDFPAAVNSLQGKLEKNLSEIDEKGLEELGYSLINDGIGPMLRNVDELGP